MSVPVILSIANSLANSLTSLEKRLSLHLGSKQVDISYSLDSSTSPNVLSKDLSISAFIVCMPKSSSCLLKAF